MTTLAAYIAVVAGHLDGATRYLFRGQRELPWALKPSVARHPRNSADVEREMLEEFKLRSIPYLESTLDLSDADWLAIAQHHEMPTRLLDWTGNALAALWFAINLPGVASADRTKEPPDAAVWVLGYEQGDLLSDQERRNPLAVNRTALFRPRHVSRRIAAQDGWFTVHRSHENKEDRFVSLESNKEFEKRVHYVSIPAVSFGSMRLQLRTAGVTSATLFPDLVGVARLVAGVYLFSDDEILPRLGSQLGLEWLIGTNDGDDVAR
ncbi:MULTISPECIES: FRG domain-containing protein [Paraburkholderia]|uniref:FRG domain-containing protein n=1 Tax=Paraburkholderia TaxID=1822464 RepID=UPI002255AAC8|nr:MULTISPECIES: FRG domain-containing protein [Paraburkholderia]MCX4166288.1 FRG domain-containing protein [Paraburkholderia megapolitana]MDN7161778.1 FRG domain-containing protein [Paraburkholderia sp. CHISQ3]MDQ6498826.1 FRG domain-containing protein [Paraburkholderia megapolitana]